MNTSKSCSENLSKVCRRDISMSKKIMVIVFTIHALTGCGPSRERTEYLEKSQAIADSVQNYVSGLSTDTIHGITHNFAKTADIKFKVKNVLDASDCIEDLAKGCGGYISLSNLSSQINYKSSVRFKEDSLAEITHYITANTLTLRVPNNALDSVVRAISKLSVFIDSRKLKADDIKLSLYANSLSEKRYNNYQKKLENKIEKSKGDLKQELKGEEEILAKQTLADNTTLNSYLMADKVNYSTLTLELYQDEQISIEKTAVEITPEPFIPSFGSQLKSAFLTGLGILENIILLITKSWTLILLFFVAYVTYKKVRPFLQQLLSSK